MQPGNHLGPYEIVAPIGAGGMGEVYRARDTRLGRDVAIKVLPAEYAADPDRLRRFELEARAASALNHPNILVVLDIGSQDGTPYIVAELLEGESLRDRLKSGGLTVRKAMETAVQMAQGLAAAHEKGIVHRDLKPENLFLTRDGHVKILDFGIAKLAPARTAGELEVATTVVEATARGAMLGTVGYMSPEQVRGQRVDQRSDIFSFGCVLYEMLSGNPPFKRDTPADTITAILAKEPMPVSALDAEIPTALQGIVHQCLEKSPEDRLSSVHDLALGLRTVLRALEADPSQPAADAPRRSLGWRIRAGVALGGVAALAGVAVLVAVGVLVFKLKPAAPSGRASGPPKIVVLPFENLGSGEDAYFAAGMTEEITSRLANVQGLGVISRTSAAEYNRHGKTVKQIGSDLDVDYVLEGSVRWEHSQGHESRVRITPQLIRVADDTHVWADRYDRVIADVFAMQSEVAENAVKAMGVTLLPHEQTRLKEVSTSDLEAYDLYLRGQELYSGGMDKRHLEGALQMYQAAVDRDQRFAQALAGLARSHLQIYWNYFDRRQDRVVRAKEAAEKAVELRPDLADSHTALGYYFYWGLLDYPRALSEFSAALKIQPNNSDAIYGTAAVLRRQGHWSDSAETMSKGLKFDPKNAQLIYNFARSCVLARRYADADRAYGLAIALSPQWGDPYGDQAWLQIQWQGDLEKARAILEEAGRVAGLTDDRGFLAQSALKLALARRDYQGALRQLEALSRHAIENQDYFLPIPLLRGEVLMVVGERDRARRSFETARQDLEQKVAQDSADARFRSSLGIIYAGLGRSAEAVREAKLGCDLMPASKDAWLAPSHVNDLAFVYTMVGQPGEAIAQLEHLLEGSAEFTPNVLRLDPKWDPLRSDPRFQALLAKYEVKP